MRSDDIDTPGGGDKQKDKVRFAKVSKNITNRMFFRDSHCKRQWDKTDEYQFLELTDTVELRWPRYSRAHVPDAFTGAFMLVLIYLAVTKKTSRLKVSLREILDLMGYSVCGDNQDKLDLAFLVAERLTIRFHRCHKAKDGAILKPLITSRKGQRIHVNGQWITTQFYTKVPHRFRVRQRRSVLSCMCSGGWMTAPNSHSTSCIRSLVQRPTGTAL